MAELSKTARASMGKQVKEVHVETTEEAIKAIRDNRAAGLHIGDMARVDKLLQAYDELKNTLKLSDAVESAAKELMVTIPAQEEDPNHMVDFGHHTAHKEFEGA
jgi:translation elongation factor EF-4